VTDLREIACFRREALEGDHLVMRPARTMRFIVVSTIALGLLVGCSTSEPSASPKTTLPSGVPAAPEPTAPENEAGPLGQSDLPAPEDLGVGWEYRIDPGSVEDGYAGSGAPAIARDPAEVVAAITPLGCRPARLSLPVHALEVTYERKATPGVGLLLEFTSSQQAEQFFSAHTAALRACVTRGQVITDVVLDEPSRFISLRTEDVGETPTWTEAVALADARVLLLATAQANASTSLNAALTQP
jgi:hypothetical protein